MRALRWFPLLSLALAACSSESPSGGDAATSDTPVVDGSGADGTTPDGSRPDGSSPDGATPDGGMDVLTPTDVPIMVDGGPGDGATPTDVPVTGDGGTGTPPRVTVCPGDALPSLPTGVCQVTAGTAGMLITGDILTPGEVLRGGQVSVDASGRITCVGCDCSAGAAGVTTVVCPDGVVSPGLINAHDHLTYAQNPPYTRTAERYEHRHDWRRGGRGHARLTSAGSASGDQMAWGELRFVMGGATSVNGSGGTAGFLRNLDRSIMEGLGQPPVRYETFPLGDSSGTLLTMGWWLPLHRHGDGDRLGRRVHPARRRGHRPRGAQRVPLHPFGANDLCSRRAPRARRGAPPTRHRRDGHRRYGASSGLPART
ncbi:MAG: hypothetical protein R3A52_09060 [Polyangiales bacterium]